MTLPDLLQAVTTQGLVPASRAKDLKTSIRYLAQALGTSPDALTDPGPLEARYQDILKAYFATRTPAPSRSTVKNTLTNLAFLFRTAHAAGLLEAAAPLPVKPHVLTHRQFRHDFHRASPYRHRIGYFLSHYYVPVEQWPADLRDTWLQYKADRQHEVRQTTLRCHESYLAAYVSWGLRLDQPALETWAQLFETRRLGRFIAWHAARVGVTRISHTGYKAAWFLMSVANYQRRPERDTLHAWVRKLKTPEPMHNKQDPDHTINPQDIEHVGLTLLAEARAPKPYVRGTGPGLFAALHHQSALILRLMVRIPLRSRNIRELQLGRHLAQDSDGTWQLRFQGEDLKIRERHGRINTFARPWPADLIEHLEEFLAHYRPQLPNSAHDRHLFLTRHGRPFTVNALGDRVAEDIGRRLRKRFYPHLIRTIMADTMLLNGVDVSTVAFQLNDSPAMVYKRYHELRANDHVKKADHFLSSLFGGPPVSP